MAAVRVCPCIHKERVKLGMILKGELALTSATSSAVATRQLKKKWQLIKHIECSDVLLVQCE